MTLEEFLREGMGGSVWRHGPGFALVHYLLRSALFVFRAFISGMLFAIIVFGITMQASVLRQPLPPWLEFFGEYVWLVAIGFGTVLQVLQYLFVPTTIQRVRREYRRHHEFTDVQFSQAALALREWKSRPYDLAVSRYTKPVVDLLLLAGGVFIMDGKVRRMVSIRAIEQDRAADAADDGAEPEIEA